MTKVCFIRHGETDWNRLGKIQGITDIPLNDTGIKQAKYCAEALIGSKYDIMITSPLQRAKQTAEIINKLLKLPLMEMDSMRERSFGEAEGLSVEERELKFPNRNYPNQEPLDAFRKRIMHGLSTIQSNYSNLSVLVVAHGAVINQILAVLSNGEIGSGKTKLQNTCLNNIHFRENKWEIKNYNLVDHLI